MNSVVVSEIRHTETNYTKRMSGSDHRPADSRKCCD